MSLVVMVCLSGSTDYNNIGKFLNRILGMAVQQQNSLFQYFADTLTAVISNAKKNGRYDMGILGKLVSLQLLCALVHLCSQENQPCSVFWFFSIDLGSGDEKVRKVNMKKFLTPGYSTSGHVELYTVSKTIEMSLLWVCIRQN